MAAFPRFGGQKTVRKLLIVAVILALAGALVVLLRSSSAQGLFSEPLPPPPPAVTVDPLIDPLPAGAPVPDPAALAMALDELLEDPGLGNFTGEISDALTGQVLWSSAPDKAVTPASTAKLLTVAAALLTLPADHKVETRVVVGTSPGEIVIVAGGDPTLSAATGDARSFYPGSARIDDLVEQIERSGIRPQALTIDLSVYRGPTMAEGWSEVDIPGGFIAPIEPLMIDGARQANDDNAPRTDTPALDAGQMIADRLGIDASEVQVGKAPADAREIARVESAPLSDRLGQMMAHSDNVLAETIGREIALATGGDPSFRGTVNAVNSVLTDAGFNVGGVDMFDSSGLSEDDRMPARILDQIMVGAAGDSHPALRPMLDFLPVAGANGTLADRYDQGDRLGAGWVRAKTGTLAEASSLAGFVVSVNSRVLTFALMSNGTAPGVSRPALDAIATALRTCVCR